MSWWTKNRKWVALAGAAAAAATGVGAPLIAGLLGGGGAGAAAGEGLLATGAMAAPEAAAALTPEMMAAAGSDVEALAAAGQPATQAMTTEASNMAQPSLWNQFTNTAGKVGSNLSKASQINSAIQALTPQQQQVQPPLAMHPAQQVSTGRLPTGYDQALTEEQKRRLMQQGLLG